MEEWKEIEIKGLKYKVSNYGRVIGFASGKLLKTRLNKDGYICVTVGKEKEGRTTERVHRLVAKLFVENPANLSEVNHIDFDRTNNYYKNLEWVSHKDNIKYTVRHNRYYTANGRTRGKNNPNYGNNTLRLKYQNNKELAKLKNSRPKEQNGRAKKVKLYDVNKNFIKEFGYIGECAEYLIKNNFTKAKIDSIRNNIRKSVKNNVLYLNHYYKFAS